MANQQDYSCTVCHREVGKENLRVKRAVFKEVGKGGATVKTRTVAWLCIVPHADGSPGCLLEDEDFNLPAYAASPGMKDTVLSKGDSDFDESDEPLFPSLDEVLDLHERLIS